MEKLKRLYLESYLFYIISKIQSDVIPAIVKAFMSSFIMCAWNFIDRKIIKSSLAKLIFDPSYIAGIWYKSFFYRSTTKRIRKISYYLPKASVSYRSLYTGAFLALILLVPDKLWSNTLWISVFTSLIIFFVSRNIRNRAGTVFTLLNVILFMFLILAGIALPYNAVVAIIYLIGGIDLFFLISFSVRTEKDLEELLLSLFVAAIILCGFALMQGIFGGSVARAGFEDGVSLGEILVLIFPFVFAYPMEYLKNPRRLIYGAVIFILFFNVILQTQSKAALIGFVVELVIFILADIKFFPFLILLMPLGLNSLIDNIRATWYATTAYGNIINNLINLSGKIWNLGFGVDTSKLMSIYNSAQLRSISETTVINFPYLSVNPVYVNFVIDIGAIFMIIFLAYILRLAHSSFTMLFIGDKKYKRFFAAGLATLVAISVSSFFETTIFASRTMLIYWAMLGVLRAVRILSLGVYEA